VWVKKKGEEAGKDRRMARVVIQKKKKGTHQFPERLVDGNVILPSTI
jgi:hypothetical protein